MSILIYKEVITIEIDRDNTKIKIYNEEGEYHDNKTDDDDDTQLSFEDDSGIINDEVYEVTSETDLEIIQKEKEGK